MSRIDKVAWLRVEGRRLLGVRSHGKSRFYLPGGKREPGESDVACLQREVAEELAVVLDPASIRAVARFEAQADAQPDGVVVVLACYAADFSGELRADAEIAELAWLGGAERPRCSPAMQAAIDWLLARAQID